jgi:hypothetical protein
VNWIWPLLFFVLAMVEPFVQAVAGRVWASGLYIGLGVGLLVLAVVRVTLRELRESHGLREARDHDAVDPGEH